MIQIYNALTRTGVPDKANIRWKRSKNGNLMAEQLGVYDSKAIKIWETYYELIFNQVKLLDRIEAKWDAIKKDAPKLWDYLKSEKTNEVDRDQLLNLLIDYPQKYKELKLTDTDEAVATVKQVFDYNFLSRRPLFGKLISMLEVNICPYCGRMFTSTSKRSGKNYIRTNQIDHYYPKSKYPYLALSIWNLIPACGPCNNRKSDVDDDKDEKIFLYPYTEGMGDYYRFVTHVQNGVSYLWGMPGTETEFQIMLEPTEQCENDESEEMRKFRSRANTEIDKLGITALYSSHKGYVCNVFRQRFVFGEPYIEDLLTTFPELFKSRGDILAMLYMKSIEEQDIGTEPLDKLTRDIDFEIDTLMSRYIHF